jgi:hypothetical protein
MVNKKKLIKFIGKYIIFLIIILPKFGQAQILLGKTLTEIRKEYPDEFFAKEYDDDGNLRASISQPMGSYEYRFEKQTGKCTMIIYEPNEIETVNKLIQEYNENFVIKSENVWKAYINDGTHYYIYLAHEEETKINVFIYSLKNLEKKPIKGKKRKQIVKREAALKG